MTNRELDKFQRDALRATADQSARRKRKPAVPKVPPTLHVIIDTREQRPWHFSEFCTVERATLGEGDYSMRGATERVRIERKGLCDLIQTCGKGHERFTNECRRLRNYEYEFLVIEGRIEDVELACTDRRVTADTVLHTVLDRFFDSRVVPFFLSNHRAAGVFAERILRRLQHVWGQATE
jgi:ERCC4-type nuclease